ncbi:uncharacterized protein ACOB8E_011602 isoform 1-T2 [Sarcophilus harrisii]
MQITRVHPSPGSPRRWGSSLQPPPPPPPPLLFLGGPAVAAAVEPGRAVQGRAGLGWAAPSRAGEPRSCAAAARPPTPFGPGAMSRADSVSNEVLGAAGAGLQLGAAGPGAGNPGGGHTLEAEP